LVAWKKNVHVLDAAVGGAAPQAETGRQGTSVGGSKDVVEEYRSLLETLGRVFHHGDVGTGQVAKLVNNMLVTVSTPADEKTKGTSDIWLR